MRSRLIVGVMVAVAASWATAHHSAASVDMSKLLTTTGTVKDFHWVNPHVWLFIVSPGAGGAAQEQAFEGPPVMALAKRGVRRSDLKAGDVVEIAYYGHRDGHPGGVLASVKLQPSGREVSMGGPPPPSAAPAAAP